MIPRPCLDCPELVTSGSRCRRCQRAQERLRNRDAKRAGYRDPEYLAQPATGICHICGEPIAQGEGTRDHLTPLAHDFLAVRTLPAHRSCNSSRGSRPIPLTPGRP